MIDLNIRFGDIIGIRGLASLGAYFLSGRAGPDGDLKNMGIVPRVLGWEQWILVDPSDPSSTRVIKCGDVVAIKSLAFSGWYVSARDTNASDGIPEVKMAPRLEAWEKWIVVQSESVTSTGIVAEGLHIAFRSQAFSNYYLSGGWPEIEGDVKGLRRVDHLSDWEKWTIEHQGVHYRDPIALKSNFFKDACLSGGWFDDGDMKGLQMAPHVRAWEQWTLVDPADTSSTRVMHFGDSVAIRSTAFGGFFVSARDKNAADGIPTVEMAPRLAAWEKWTVIDPQNPSSTQPIPYGAGIAFKSQGFSGNYLSGGWPGATSDATIKGVRRVDHLSDWEKWIVVDQSLRYGVTLGFASNHYAGYRLSARLEGENQPNTTQKIEMAARFMNWELWKLVHPSEPGSTARIYFGNQVALQSSVEPSLYVSGRNSDAPAIQGKPVALVPRLESWETWILVNPQSDTSDDIVPVSGLPVAFNCPAHTTPFARFFLAGVDNKSVHMDPSCTPGSSWEMQPPELMMESLRSLVDRFAPRVRFHEDESYLVSSVEWFLARATLHNKYTGATKSPVSGSDLPTIPNTDNQYCLTIPNDARGGDLDSARTYVHVRATPFPNVVDIQYWFFYPYNGPGTARVKSLVGDTTMHAGNPSLAPLGEHTGDWEHITARVDMVSGNVIDLYLSQHDSGTWVGDMSQVQRNGDHLVVYASLNGHAMYLSEDTNYTEHRKFTDSTGTGIEFFLRNDTSEGGRSIDFTGRCELISVSGIDAPKLPEPSWINYLHSWGPKGTAHLTTEAVKDCLHAAFGVLSFAIDFTTVGLIAELLVPLFITRGYDGPDGPKQHGEAWNAA